MAKPVLQPLPAQPAQFPENEPGRYSVNAACIDCDLCRQAAPDNFTRETTKGHSYVYQQPENKREEAQCREALETCPVNAIADVEAAM